MHLVRPYQDNISRFVRLVCATFTPDYASATPAIRHDPHTPVFIVGLPRSGSTLLESMLANNPTVTPLGENQIMAEIILHVSGSRTPSSRNILNAFASVTPEVVQSTSALYGSLLELYGKTAILLDKSLTNFLYIGFIKRLFPDARFIHLTRNPLDLCFNCFEMRFTHGHAYSFSLDSLAEYYLHYHNLMRHWTRLFPSDILSVSYENLVTDTSATLTPVTQFLALDQTEKLQDVARDKAAFTPSTEQIRKPVHSNSVGKARHYSALLEPLKDRLVQAGINVEAGWPQG